MFWAMAATRTITFLGLAASFVAFGHVATPALGATPPIAESPKENPITQEIVDMAPEPVRSATPVALQLLRAANPLWAIPLESLSVTRERPVFSPSRRPPPPAVVAAPYIPPAAPPPPEEPDHPPLTLMGTVIGETESIGVFFDQSEQTAIRLKTGQDYTGWILRSVQGREAMFEKNRRTATLALPANSGEQAAQLPIPRPAGTKAGNGRTDGNAQIVRPPPNRAPQPIAASPGPVAQVEDEAKMGRGGSDRGR